MIEPEEIRRREFNKVLRGYDTVEVRYFLEMLADELESLQKKLGEYEVPGFEGKSPGEIVEQARRKADEIVEEARQKAAEIIRAAERQRDMVEREIDKLKVKRHEIIKQVEELVYKLRYFVEAGIPDFREERSDESGV